MKSALSVAVQLLRSPIHAFRTLWFTGIDLLCRQCTSHSSLAPIRLVGLKHQPSIRKENKIRMTRTKEILGELMQGLDKLIFFKSGYSFWKHWIPFAIAALLLVILTIPEDNLLLRLADRLQQPSWIWLPAGLLTFAATSVYIFAINAQIRKAYLWPDGDLCRTIGTSLAYIVPCTLMAYVVLRSASRCAATWQGIWASFLLAILSLTGVGWSGPDTWVESMGIQSPDYTDGRLAAARLTKILQLVRGKAMGERRDVEDFLIAAKSLRANIEANLVLEPRWAKGNLQRASNALRALAEQTQERFPTSDELAVEDFGSACRCQQRLYYQEFATALGTLSDYWSKWRCPEP
jgi:hypothetical protein